MPIMNTRMTYFKFHAYDFVLTMAGKNGKPKLVEK